MKLLIDENLSPRLAIWANDLGIPPQAVGHVGLQGKPDHMVWEYACRNDQIVVTVSAISSSWLDRRNCIPASSCCAKRA